MDDISLRLLQHHAAGLCCSQIMLALALEEQGRGDADLVRAMAGLCNGLGDCAGPCGVLSGGACLLASYAAKGAAEETAHERFPLMLQTFTDWFRETMSGRFGGVTCGEIMGLENCGRPDPQRCGGILAEAYGRCLEILVEEGLDPSQPPSRV